MAAKSGIFDFVFKSGAKAAKQMSKGAAKTPKSAAPGRVGPNVNVLPSSPGAATSAGRTRNYIAETGRPKVVNGRPIPNSLMRPAPAKKAAPAKKMAPAKRTPAELAQMGKAAGAAKAARMQKLKAEKAPVPPRGAIPVKKAQPGRVSPETARKLAVMNKNKTYTQRRDAVRMLPAKPPVKKFR